MPGSFEAVDAGESASFIDTQSDSSLGECAYLTGLEDAMAAAVQKAKGDSKSLQEVQSQADWPSWKAVMNREMDMLEKVGTWKTVHHPPSKNVVRCKWVFHIKHKANGSIEKYKVWLVACGFTQIHGVNYFDIYSPIIKLASFRLILALAACFG